MSKLIVDNACLDRKKLNFIFFFISLFSGIARNASRKIQQRTKDPSLSEMFREGSLFCKTAGNTSIGELHSQKEMPSVVF